MNSRDIITMALTILERLLERLAAEGRFPNGRKNLTLLTVAKTGSKTFRQGQLDL